MYHFFTKPLRRLVDCVAESHNYRNTPAHILLEPCGAALKHIPVVMEQTEPGPIPHQHRQTGGYRVKREYLLSRGRDDGLKTQFHLKRGILLETLAIRAESGPSQLPRECDNFAFARTSDNGCGRSLGIENSDLLSE